MKVLCLGHSRIAQNRVLPALAKIDAVDGIEVASRRGAPAPGDPGVTAGYGDYEDALATSDAGLVYVSTVNEEHAPWAEAALARGFHVVVDKPSVTRLADAERLAALAEEKGLVLAEATVYGAHPQIAAIRRVFAEAGSVPTKVAAQFCMPPLPEGNFRHRRDLGGGAFLDLGPYAVSIGRLLFDAEPESVFATVDARHDEDDSDAVETAFSALLRYPGGRTVVGHFGFDAEYTNAVSVIGPGASIRLDRVFTTPPDLRNELHVRVRNEARTVTADAGCPFALFLAGVIEAIRRGDRTTHPSALLADARALDALRRAASGGEA